MLHTHFYAYLFLYNDLVHVTFYSHLKNRYFSVVYFVVKICYYDGFAFTKKSFYDEYDINKPFIIQEIQNSAS